MLLVSGPAFLLKPISVCVASDLTAATLACLSNEELRLCGKALFTQCHGHEMHQVPRNVHEWTESVFTCLPFVLPHACKHFVGLSGQRLKIQILGSGSPGFKILVHILSISIAVLGSYLTALLHFLYL